MEREAFIKHHFNLSAYKTKRFVQTIVDDLTINDDTLLKALNHCHLGTEIKDAKELEEYAMHSVESFVRERAHIDARRYLPTLEELYNVTIFVWSPHELFVMPEYHHAFYKPLVSKSRCVILYERDSNEKKVYDLVYRKDRDTLVFPSSDPDIQKLMRMYQNLFNQNISLTTPIQDYIQPIPKDVEVVDQWFDSYKKVRRVSVDFKGTLISCYTSPMHSFSATYIENPINHRIGLEKAIEFTNAIHRPITHFVRSEMDDIVGVGWSEKNSYLHIPCVMEEHKLNLPMVYFPFQTSDSFRSENINLTLARMIIDYVETTFAKSKALSPKLSVNDFFQTYTTTIVWQPNITKITQLIVDDKIGLSDSLKQKLVPRLEKMSQTEINFLSKRNVVVEPYPQYQPKLSLVKNLDVFSQKDMCVFEDEKDIVYRTPPILDEDFELYPNKTHELDFCIWYLLSIFTESSYREYMQRTGLFQTVQEVDDFKRCVLIKKDGQIALGYHEEGKKADVETSAMDRYFFGNKYPTKAPKLNVPALILSNNDGVYPSSSPLEPCGYVYKDGRTNKFIPVIVVNGKRMRCDHDSKETKVREIMGGADKKWTLVRTLYS